MVIKAPNLVKRRCRALLFSHQDKNRLIIQGAKISYTSLEFQSNPPVAVLTLSCPEKCNLIGAAMAAEIRQACQDISEDDGLALVLLTGAGACFSVGQDRPVQGAPDDAPGDGAAIIDLGWIKDHQMASALAALAIPVVVAINGDAFDHGLELALAGDIRVAARDARFGFTGLAQGLLPWDGGTQRLPRRDDLVAG